jgi:hypothetical protein
MEQPNLIEEQVRANLPKVEQRPEFAGNRLWLTFYLGGPPENLERVSIALGKSGWTNLGSWEGGFLYPKVQVEKSVRAIVEIAARAQELCVEEGAEIIHIDADTTPDMNSRCITLYHSPA